MRNMQIWLLLAAWYHVAPLQAQPDKGNTTAATAQASTPAAEVKALIATMTELLETEQYESFATQFILPEQYEAKQLEATVKRLKSRQGQRLLVALRQVNYATQPSYTFGINRVSILAEGATKPIKLRREGNRWLLD